MPIFILLSGMLSKIDMSVSRTIKNITSLIVPFLVFTILYEIFNVITQGRLSYYTTAWQPYWILWFLFSMFIWKTLLPIIIQFRFPLILSIFISLAAGYVNGIGYFLGLSRTIYFFPFFLAGYILGPNVLSSSFLGKIPKLAFAAILILNVCIFWLCREFPHQWLYGSLSYAKMGNVEIHTFLIRAALYLISFTSSIAIMMLIPNKKSRVTKLGENSLFVYVWHGFFVKAAIYFGLIHMLSNTSNAVALTTLFAAAIIITVSLSSQFVAIKTKVFLLRPFQKLILKKVKQ